ncbi:MAG: zinc ribbon domain-containing protein [Clostridiales bacterium]|nr:zinc ribbon domain-containing protein [Clostridiales bacterium]
MPFYDMKCKRCAYEFNVMATIEEKEKELIPCPGCGSKELERIFTKSNVSVKSRAAEAKENCKCCSFASGCPNARK